MKLKRLLLAAKPYRKAIVAALCAMVTVAAKQYDAGWLQVLSAGVTPFLVYLVPNKPANPYDWHNAT